MTKQDSPERKDFKEKPSSECTYQESRWEDCSATEGEVKLVEILHVSQKRWFGVLLAQIKLAYFIISNFL